MRKVCFVCTGNTCRSPMAEKLMKMHLKEQQIDDVSVTSCGLCVNDGDKINPKAVVSLKKLGVKSCSKKAKQIKSGDLKKDVLFITMTLDQKNAFKNYNNVFTLGELVDCGDIDDPYGKTQDVYDAVAQKIDQCTNKLVENLKQYR